METFYLKAHPLGDRYPEWTPNLHSDRSQDSNPCARGSQGPSLSFLVYTMWGFYESLWAKGDLLSETPPTWGPLPRVDAQSPLRL